MTSRPSTSVFLIAAIAVAAVFAVGCGKHAEQPASAPAAKAVAEQPPADLPMPKPAEDTGTQSGGSISDATLKEMGERVEDALRKLPEKDRDKARAKAIESAIAGMALPPGPLNDTKYVAITTKLSMVAILLPEGERTAKRLDGILEKILKGTDVTTAEFEKYTAQIAADPERKARLGTAMEQLKDSGWARREPAAGSGDQQ